ncbi:hypothetical protein LCGC14_1242490 [marine sediment metagenome]|uniref:Uncharacterized protein n=1 Tax=marine sediment metagenome TaxID=412755 RepID=A0A0F9LSJ5_9ZZZZ
MPAVEMPEPERRKRKVRKIAVGNGKAEKAEVGDADVTEDLAARGVFFPKKKKPEPAAMPVEIVQPVSDSQVELPLEPQPAMQPAGPPRVDMFPQQPAPVTDEGSLVLYHLDAKDLGTINILTNFLVDMGYIRATDPGLMFKFAIEYLRVGVMKEIDASLEKAVQQTD